MPPVLLLKRTDSSDPDFQGLVKLLDAELAFLDGDEHAFYAQLNKTDMIRHVVLAYENGIPVACGAFRAYEEGTVEVKRMFVLPGHRGKGLSRQVLNELEKWAKETGHTHTILETGLKQPAAISLYESSGYARIPNYGKYAGVENSVCMQKQLP